MDYKNTETVAPKLWNDTYAKLPPMQNITCMYSIYSCCIMHEV